MNFVYPPIVITNIVVNIFFPYRGFKLTGSVPSTDDDIISTMEKIGHIIITAINTKKPRGNRNKIIVVIIKSNDSSDLKKIKKIINDIDNSDTTKSNTLDELFIILNEEFFERKNFNDIIKELHSRQKGDADYNGKSAFYTICPYHNFAFDVTKCKEVIPHILMSKEEVNELLQKERINFKDLPVILHTDLPIIWNGGRVGEVVRILRNSESAMHSIYYRRIEYGLH